MVRMSGWRVVVVVGISLVGVLILTLHKYDGSTGGDKTNWMGFTDREARLA
jgi:hypothetical protein